MSAIYLNDWAGSGFEGMVASFRASYSTPRAWDGVEVLIASYSYKDYSGRAFVLFRKGGVLYEVNGSHCSCYGLEGQWEPEETTVAALRMRDFPPECSAEIATLLLTLEDRA